MNLIPYFVVPYVVLLINCLLFKVLRAVLFPITPQLFRILVTEFISTLELCCDCAELGVIWELHGNIGYGISLFLVCLWWAEVFEDAEACPCGPIEDCLLTGQSITSKETVQKLLGQILAAIMTAKYTNFIWCWHLVPEHSALHTNKCQASLQVSAMTGMTIEAIITFISRVIALESVYWNQNVANYVNSISSVGLVLAALNTTGGYFNPIMASALTLGCEGNTLIEHLLVYWIGSLVGGIIARSFHLFILRSNLRFKSE